MALLEAWKMGRPALVNAGCAVLRGQVQRANGGLYYRTYEEFSECLSWLLERPAVAEALGRSGREYFRTHYSWETVMAKYDRLLATLSRGA
jgi:glycosyltransferase involved in cell wall biosynthesis